MKKTLFFLAKNEFLVGCRFVGGPNTGSTTNFGSRKSGMMLLYLPLHAIVAWAVVGLAIIVLSIALFVFRREANSTTIVPPPQQKESKITATIGCPECPKRVAPEDSSEYQSLLGKLADQAEEIRILNGHYQTAQSQLNDCSSNPKLSEAKTIVQKIEEKKPEKQAERKPQNLYEAYQRE